MTSTAIYPEYPCITEVAIANFKPTYLMVKRHRKSGLMYFCKTTGKDPIKYLGSGTRWKRHINKHGREHVETIWYQQFDDILLLVEFALGFSKDADIVASKEWANLKPEDGLYGGWQLSHDTLLRTIAKANARIRVLRETSPQWALTYSKALTRGLKSSYASGTRTPPGWSRTAIEKAAEKDANEKRKNTFILNKHMQGEKNSMFGRRWMYRDQEVKPVLAIEIEEHLALGWSFGRKGKAKKLSKEERRRKKINARIEMIQNSGVDVSQRRWLHLMSALTGVSRHGLKKFIQKHMPDYWSKCFIEINMRRAHTTP